jgi:hypothetical protein
MGAVLQLLPEYRCPACPWLRGRRSNPDNHPGPAPGKKSTNNNNTLEALILYFNTASLSVLITSL